VKTANLLCISARTTLAAIVLGIATAHAQTVSFVNSDLTTHGAWRTPGVNKPLDVDGNNIYGSDGYYLFGGTPANVASTPSYATVANLTNWTAVANPGFVQLDNPQGAGLISSGLWFVFTPGNLAIEDDFARITVTQAKSFRVGILTNNVNASAASPDQLRIRQTVGGAVNSGAINSSVNTLGDWFFFDISNAKVGDIFVVSGRNVTSRTENGIGAITFDSIASVAPEPGTLMFLALGMVGGIALRWRRS
jgi:hypothetical protein